MKRNTLKHYNFLHDPFSDNPSEFSFFAQNRAEVLEKLKSFAKNVLLVVIGDSGSGKTVLKNIFIAELDHNINVINLNEDDFNKDLLEIIADQSKVDGQLQRSKNIAALVAHFKSQTEQIFYLIVDDADKLSAENINLLTQFSKVIKVIFFAKSNILDNDFARLNPQIIKLPTCNDRQVRDYLSERLTNACSDISIFNEQQLARIFLVSKGLFGKINLIAGQLLDDKSSFRRKTNTKMITIGLSLGIITIISLIVFLPFVNKSASQADKVVNTVSIPVINHHHQINEISDDVIVQDSNLQDDSLIFEHEPSVTNAEEVDVIEQKITELENQIADKEQEIKEITTVLEPPEISSSVVAQTPPARNASKNQSKIPKNKVIISNEQNNDNYAIVFNDGLPIKKLLDPNKSNSSQNLSKKQIDSQGNTPDKSWYLQQNAQHFCLQIIAGPSETAIKKMAQSYGAGFRYFKKVVNSKTFYVLTYGSFTTRADAQNHIPNLPNAIQTNKPFAIKFADIHVFLK